MSPVMLQYLCVCSIINLRDHRQGPFYLRCPENKAHLSLFQSTYTIKVYNKFEDSYVGSLVPTYVHHNPGYIGSLSTVKDVLMGTGVKRTFKRLLKGNEMMAW